MKRVILATVIALFTVSLSLYAGEKDFFFVQISDPQIGFTAGNDNLEPDIEALGSAVEIINLLKPAFVVVTGDMVNSRKMEEQWEIYKTLISKIDASIPVYHIPGNHDTGKADDSNTHHIDDYKKRMGNDRFSFIFENCLFVGYDSSIIKDGNTVLEPIQYEWLDKVLDTPASLKIVFTHCPVFKKDFEEKEDYSNYPVPMRQRYWELFQNHSVKAVGAGHTHHERTSSYNDIDMLTCGPVTRPLGKGSSGLAVWRISPATGSYEYHYYSFDNIQKNSNN